MLRFVMPYHQLGASVEAEYPALIRLFNSELSRTKHTPSWPIVAASHDDSLILYRARLSQFFFRFACDAENELIAELDAVIEAVHLGLCPSSYIVTGVSDNGLSVTSKPASSLTFDSGYNQAQIVNF